MRDFVFMYKIISQKHGLSNHPLYNIWGKMKSRCNNHKSKDYYMYGGRGVKVCPEWEHDFKAFYDWAMMSGWKRGLEIDKDYIPKKEGREALIYSPENCCFLTQKQNCNYRRNNHFICFDGKEMNLRQWEDELKLPYGILIQRIGKLGWTIEKALTTPVFDVETKKPRVISLRKKGLTTHQISSELKMCRKTISKILKANNLL